MMTLAAAITAGYQLSPNFSPDPGWVTWAEARAHCAGLGLELASIKSEAQQVAFSSEIEKLQPAGTVSTMLWIGGSVAEGGDPANEADWSWVDGTVIGFSNWRESHPRFTSSGHRQLQPRSMCMEHYKNDGKYVWGSAGCAGTRSFACADVGGVKNLPPAPPAQPRPPPSPPASPPPSPPFPVTITVVVALSVVFFASLLMAVRMHTRRRHTARAAASTTSHSDAPPKQVKEAIEVTQPDGRPAVALA